MVEVTVPLVQQGLTFARFISPVTIEPGTVGPHAWRHKSSATRTPFPYTPGDEHAHVRPMVNRESGSQAQRIDA
jgi:hypothetical protein